MAVPADFTTANISGKFVMNKLLSDPFEPILQLQGIGWFKRKVISVGTVTLYIKHYQNDEGAECIDIDQTITGGYPGTREERILSWTDGYAEDSLFGAVVGKTRRVKASELEEDFLTKNWTAETLEHGLIQSYVNSDTPKSGTPWIANQTWGMEDINGERRHVRHVDFKGPKDEEIKARLVYDYLGPL
ncbi:hypothetical protein C8J57DRAFT_1125638 [Mycena rebaudengoi]|nr:hypothetical protein C8J57DRAFT_1125638 [Mycena rebaudengoi]